MQKKNTIFFIAGIVFAAGIVGMMSVRAGNNAVDCSLDFYTAIDIYPVDETMMSAGYEKVTENNWHCVLNNLDVYVTYDYENRICCKNNYYFRLEDLYIKDEKTYLSKNMLEEILTSEISRENNKIVVTEKDYSDFDWTSSPVITHAGGAVREKGELWYYTNSKDALIQNYSLGCRLFEFDMYPTNDDNLAIVHDWTQFGRLDGTYLSAEEWLNFKTGTSNVSDGKYETMLIGTLMDEMQINQDLFVITDTKSTEFSQEVIRRQFEIIYREAAARDLKLLNRVIPQIYNKEMYDIVQSVYKFPNLIFTCYATEEPGEEIVEFCIAHEEFKAVTAPFSEERLTQTDIARLHQHELKLYFHTIYSYAELAEAFKNGADGVHSGIFTPDEVGIYLDAAERMNKENLTE